MSETHDVDEADIRARLGAAFGDRPTVDFATAARLLNMTEKTLRRHVADGNIAFRAIGTGSIRMRREFTTSDLTDFYARARQRSYASPIASKRTRFRQSPYLDGFLARIEAEAAEGSNQSH